MKNVLFEKWKPMALEVEPLDQLPVPWSVLAGEAIDVAKMCKQYWRATRDQNSVVKVPGLELAARPGLFEENIGEEILELQDATNAAHSKYAVTVKAAPGAPMERSQYVLREIKAALTFLFEDGVDNDEDARMERLEELHGEVYSQDDVAMALDTYSSFAETHR